MVYSQEKEVERLERHLNVIDDLYYEVFRLLQDKLEKTVNRYSDAVPTVRDAHCAGRKRRLIWEV